MGLTLLKNRFGKHFETLNSTVERVSAVWSAMSDERKKSLPYISNNAKPQIGTNTTLAAVRVSSPEIVLSNDGLMTTERGLVSRVNAEKTECLGRRAIMACCGYVDPARAGADIIRHLFRCYWNEFKQELPPKDMAAMIGQVASMMYQFTGLDFYPLFVAYDDHEKKSRIYDIWGTSGSGDEKEDYWTNGSGGLLAFSHLSENYLKMVDGDLAREKVMQVSVAAIHHARHQVTSANDIHQIVIVNADGIKKIPLDIVQKLLEQAKKNCGLCGYQTIERGYIQP